MLQSLYIMKKSIIITVVIAVLILGFFVGMGFFGKKLTERSMGQAAFVARNASIRATTSMIVPYIEIWGSENKDSFDGFIDQPANLSRIKSFIADLEKNLNVKIRYIVSSTANHYVVRLGVEGESLFCCADSTGAGSSEHLESAVDQFASETNCAGQPL